MAAGLHKDTVKLVLSTHAPQHGSAALFYAAVLLELQHIQDVLSTSTVNTARKGGVETQHARSEYGGEKATLSADAKEALALAIQLNDELHRLQRLDETILRTSNVMEILEAPPMLAPGPWVSGAASATVRLKQLRAAFVSRSQQVNMAYSSYRCVSKHNDLYKTYVRTSDDLHKSSSGDVSGVKTIMAVNGHVLSKALSAASDAACTPSTVGGQLPSPASSSFGSGVVAAKFQQFQQSPAALRPQQQNSQRRRSQSNNRRVSYQRSSFGSSTGRRSCQRNSGSSSKRNSGSTSSKRTSNVSKGDSASLCSANSSSICSATFTACSPPDPCPLRSESFAEKIVTAIPKRVRSGFFGLAGLFCRNRAARPAPEALRQHTMIQKGVEAETEAPLRRSLSEPAMARRRCGADFGAEAAAAAARVSYRLTQEESARTGGPRKSRDGKRASGDIKAAALRSRSEPALWRDRGGARDHTRRAGFAMASVEDVDYDAHFITVDLTTRSQLFNSERQSVDRLP